MDYDIICVSDQYSITAAAKLRKAVKDYISMGWEPQGGVSTSISGSGIYTTTIMTQAMIKNSLKK